MKLLAMAALLVLPLRLASTPQECVEVRREVYLMGTVATMTVCATDRESGLEQLERILRVLEETEEELSTWRAESVVSRLNRTPAGSPFDLDARMARLFGDLFFWYRKTGGTFDAGVGALTEAWGIHKQGKVPTYRELEHARNNSGLKHFAFNAGKRQIVRLRNATIDVGGFGKGEALDRAVDFAEAHRLKPFLIDFGGQILAYGAPAGKPGWGVDLAHPVVRDRPALSLQLASGSLSTSAGAERDLQTGNRRIGHILDPRTGQGVTSNISVTVWHERGLAADILSTALYVMGVDDGLKWAEANNVAACFLIPEKQQTLQYRSSTAWEKQQLASCSR